MSGNASLQEAYTTSSTSMVDVEATANLPSTGSDAKYSVSLADGRQLFYTAEEIQRVIDNVIPLCHNGKLTEYVMSLQADQKEALFYAICVVKDNCPGTNVPDSAKVFHDISMSGEPMFTYRSLRKKRARSENSVSSSNNEPEEEALSYAKVAKIASLSVSGALSLGQDVFSFSDLKLLTAIIEDDPKVIQLPGSFKEGFPKAYNAFLAIAKKADLKIDVCLPTISLNNYAFTETKAPVNDKDKASFKTFYEILSGLGHISEADNKSLPLTLGQKVARQLLATSFQKVTFNTDVPDYEKILPFPPGLMVAFKSCMSAFCPSVATFSDAMVSALRKLSNSVIILLKDNRHTATLQRIVRSYYATGGQAYDRLCPIAQKKALKPGVSKKNPKPSDYKIVASVSKPSINTYKVILTPEEIDLIKSINVDLNKAGSFIPKEAVSINSVEFKRTVQKLISDLFTKCKIVDNVIASRKKKAHDILVDTKDGDDQKGFSPEQWRNAIARVISDENLSSPVIIALGQTGLIANGRVAIKQLVSHLCTE